MCKCGWGMFRLYLVHTSNLSSDIIGMIPVAGGVYRNLCLKVCSIGHTCVNVTEQSYTAGGKRYLLLSVYFISLNKHDCRVHVFRVCPLHLCGTDTTIGGRHGTVVHAHLNSTEQSQSQGEGQSSSVSP